MNKILFTAIVVAATTVFYSCSDNNKETQEEVKTEQTTEPEAKPKKEESHDVVGGELQLNDGKKWVANQETTRGVDNMIILMDGFSDVENVDGYHELGKMIKIEFSNIFKQCTMTGLAHDQLHNFLIPIKNSFKGLFSDDLETCKTTYGTLRSHLDKYDAFFVTEK